MDTLVARYSRPAFEAEGYSQYEQRELSKITPSLSLNFALPPLANVSSILVCWNGSIADRCGQQRWH